MKKIKLIRLFTLLSLSALFVACNDYNDSDFRPRDTSFGWIEFNSAGRELSYSDAELNLDSLPFATVPVNLEVITNPDGFTYTYTAQVGEFGMNEDNEQVFLATGDAEEFTVDVPALLGQADIEYLLDPNFDPEIDEEFVVQFVLVDVSKPNTTVGVEGDSSSNTIFNLLITPQAPLFSASDWIAESVICVGDGSGGCDPDNSDIPVTHAVSITPGDAGNEFNLSDITGGLYEQLYEAADNPVLVNADFETNELFVIDQDDVVYGGDVFNGSGTFTVEDGVLVEFELEWSNGWGDAGETVFTRAE